MNILINCSNLKTGGALQVANSVCSQLNRFAQHRFYVVLASCLTFTKKEIEQYGNVEVYTYDIPNSIKTVLQGKDDFLDNLVREGHVQAVLTIFGPSRWCPAVSHLCGFAIPHLVIPESPFFANRSFTQKIKWQLFASIRKWSFKRCARYFWTENEFISERLNKLFPNRTVYTVTNYYNQVYDNPSNWKRNYTLPAFGGITCLSISSYYSHKNFEILIDIARAFKNLHPDRQVRFVLTIDEKQMPVPTDVRNNFFFCGKVDVSECPYLYEQCDVMIMPSLLECFTATYPEAMRMKKPIVTTDLEFARGLCGDAACYYSAIEPIAASEAIYKVATDKKYAEQLVRNGMERLKLYDNYEQRAEKLIRILEDIVSNDE